MSPSSLNKEVFIRRPPANESRFATIFGWVTVVSTGMLLSSGMFDAMRRGLPSRWGQAAAFTIFVLAHIGSVGRKRPPIARALASLLYLGCVLEAYWFSWGPEDGTIFAWSNLNLGAVRDGLLLWGLGLGALVLTLTPPRAHIKLLGSMLGLFLMLPWIWGLSRGSSRLTIIEGPEWMDWGWYIQPAFLGLSLLLPLALVALVETAYKIRGMGALEHGVMVGLGFLSLAPLGLIGLHQFASDLVEPAPQLSAADYEGEHETQHGSQHGHGTSPPLLQHDEHSEEHAEASEEPAPPAWGLEAMEDVSLCSALLHPERPLDDLEAAISTEQWQAISSQILSRRYPDAAWLINALAAPSELELAFPAPPVSWRRIVRGLSSAVYEATRQVGFEQLSETHYSYPLGSESLLKVPRLSLFPRSEVWASLPKPIRDLRLTARTFEGHVGTKGLENTLDDLNAYTWSLLTEIALLDQTAGRDIAARDAVLANLAYTESYLTYARNMHPEDYRKITETEGVAEAAVLFWDRAVCALRLSGTETRLGIEDVGLLPIVFRPDHPPAVDRLRTAPPAEESHDEHVPDKTHGEHAPDHHAPDHHAPDHHAPDHH